jgi:hypothetical protein
LLGLENHGSKRFSEKKPLQDLTDIAYRLQHLIRLGTWRCAFLVAMWVATGPVGEAQRVGIYYRTLGSSGAKAKEQQQVAVYLSLKGKRRQLDLLTPL